MTRVPKRQSPRPARIAGRIALGTAGALALGALLYGAARTRDAGTSPEPRATRPGPPKEPLPEGTSASSRAAPAAPSEDRAVPPEPPADPRPALAGTLDRSRDRLAVLERRFELQEAEPGWSDPLGERLIERFRASGLDDIAEIETVECRRTLCEIHVRYRSDADLGEKIARLINDWLRRLPACNYHVPSELLLSAAESGEVPQRLWLECRAP